MSPFQKKKILFKINWKNISKENESLIKENIFLFSKLNDLCEGNNSLKNKINLVKKEKELLWKKTTL